MQVWLAPTFLPVQSLTPYAGPNGSLAFTPDSQSVAFVNAVGGVNIHHLPDGLLTRAVPVDTGEATWNLIFPDNDTLYASGHWDRAGVWRVADGRLLRHIGNNREFVFSTAFSPDSAHLVVANSLGPDGSSPNGSGGVEMLRASDGAHVRTFTQHNDLVNSVAFSPDGTRVASASGSQPPDTRDTRIFISPASGVGPPLVLPGHFGGTVSVAFSPDNQLLASGGRDNLIRLWRVSDGSVVRTMGGNANWVTSVAFSPDGQTIASTTYNGVQLWRASDGRFLRSMDVTPGDTNVGHVAFSSDGSIVAVAAGSYPPRVWFWRVSDGAVVKTYDRETGGCSRPRWPSRPTANC